MKMMGFPAGKKQALSLVSDSSYQLTLKIRVELLRFSPWISIEFCFLHSLLLKICDFCCSRCEYYYPLLGLTDRQDKFLKIMLQALYLFKISLREIKLSGLQYRSGSTVGPRVSDKLILGELLHANLK